MLGITPQRAINPLIVQKILEIRDQPPEGLQRTPGPKAILYYLPRHLDLFCSAFPLPRSTRTVYRILKNNQRIAEHRSNKSEPIERPEPMQEWQLDFKDVSTVRPDQSRSGWQADACGGNPGRGGCGDLGIA